MQSRARARWIATIVVLTIATLAHAALKVTDNPATTQTAPSGVAQNIVVSVRNTSSASLAIMSIAKSNPACPADVMIEKSGGGLVGATLEPNEQVQYVVRAPNGVTADTTCVWQVTMTAPNPPEQFTTTFRTTGMASGFPADAQPMNLDFGAPASFEVQDILLTSYSAMTIPGVVATISGTGDVRFFGTCDNLQSCTVGDVAAFGTVPLKVKCQRTDPGIATGMIEWKRSGTMTLATQSWSCAQGTMGVAQIFIVDPAPILIQGPQNQQTPPRNVGVDSAGMTASSLTQVSLMGATNIAFDSAFCGTNLCAFPPGTKPLPTTIPIVCTPGGMPTSATLGVQGANGPMDSDTATVQCSASAGGPQISVTPPNITAPDTTVMMTAGPFPVTITNNGTADLMFSIAVTGSTQDWTVDGCVAPASCTVAGNGATRAVNVTFAPKQHGLRPATLDITSNAGNRSVTLGGRGVGGVLDVVTPVDNAIDFGVIARDQEKRETVQLANIGNAPIEVAIGMPGAPFGVSTTMLSIAAGATVPFEVTCRSADAGGPFTDVVTLAAPAAYRTETMAIDVTCEIANTNVQVQPELDFGEVRKGEPAEPIELVVTNPGPSAATITQMRLGAMPTGLAFAPPALPITLAPGQSSPGGTLSLATTDDTDLEGADLLVTVDTETLRLPITGKVVTPSAYVAPEQLDLGTACVGTPVTGNVMMINDGTATLIMQAPTLDQRFTFVPAPSDFPKPLRAGTSEIVTVSPRTSQVGVVAGVLDWDVDIDIAPFRIPVELEYIDAGTAISPGSLAFGTIELERRSFAQTVTIENCSTAPVLVSVAGVRAELGAAEAWDVQPRLDRRELGPRDKMTIAIVFAPVRPGRHVALLQLDVDDRPSEVELVADAVGFFQEPTSFYACGCAHTTEPAHGWPIAAAVLLVVRRRQRRAHRTR